MQENNIILGCGMQSYYDTGMQDFWNYHIVTKIDPENNVVHMIDLSDQKLFTRPLRGLLDKPEPKFPGSKFPKTPYEEWTILSPKVLGEKIASHKWTKTQCTSPDKRLFFIDTKYADQSNAWKLFITVGENERQLIEQLDTILTDEVIQRFYHQSKMMYSFSKSRNTLFGSTLGEIYAQYGPFETITAYECLMRFGIDAMEEVREKNYATITKKTQNCTHVYKFSHIDHGLSAIEVYKCTQCGDIFSDELEH